MYFNWGHKAYSIIAYFAHIYTGHWIVATSMMEPHKSKISEKDTSENILHISYRHARMFIEMRNIKSIVLFMQVNVLKAHNWEI